tara:strand:- start:1987 stop:2409 length:423 start_codon:yes stop_codon:yes gene_type:complete
MSLKHIGYYISKGKCLKVYELKKTYKSGKVVKKRMNYKKKILKKGTKVYKKKSLCLKVLKQKVRSKPKTTRRKIRVTKRSKFGNTCTYSLPYFGMNVPSISKTTSGTNETGLTSTAWMWPAPPGSLNLDRQQGSWYKYKM